MTREEAIDFLKKMCMSDFYKSEREAITTAIEELERPHIDLPFEFGTKVYVRFPDGGLCPTVFSAALIENWLNGATYYATREEADAALKGAVDE
jgi:hypothetical protein